nr:hypothetical protein L204_06517 [Cryptococcus depauperatus CBS 7855]
MHLFLLKDLNLQQIKSRGVPQQFNAHTRSSNPSAHTKLRSVKNIKPKHVRTLEL